jgi:uncharacterized membrane protein HdeD (DUF308 family)
MTATATPSSPDLRDIARDVGRLWWVYLVSGIIWLLFGWVVLSRRTDTLTVWAVAVYAGILFLLFGVGELVAGFVAERYRWVHAFLGVVGIVAGIVAFAWPGETFVTLAVIIAWFLLFDGTVHIIESLARRREIDLWWMFLVIGIIEVLIAFWAIGYPGRSITLLIIWVGASALVKGLSQIFAAFALHGLDRDLARG